MDLFRCPTCLGILADPSAEKCMACGQRLGRKPPIVRRTIVSTPGFAVSQTPFVQPTTS